ncbi:hypothetical protein N7539_009554 [Penicillium diatomitis]|uniref:FAD dependent oxidoreductase domain-containing protein n=1 Tax=Penicillium diatomitis TaxID=2819901 RepID=A0A9W9WKA4_9EURO|nr:uncharacterized protein N7539_009554 [Penicillium diatomitis]KAJ5466598.1 hypothetical protein N7539_009554 [Penicillium diatomitis]
MDSNVHTPKPFPQPAAGYTQPFWRTELDDLDSHQSSADLPPETEILIIGGGYAGASAAYHLFNDAPQDKSLGVVLLEGRELCSGATGRNGGHLRPDLYAATKVYQERYGLEAAAEVVRYEISHMKQLEETVRNEGIDCDLTFTRSYDIFLDADHLAAAKAYYDSLVQYDLDFMSDVEYLTEKEAQTIAKVKNAKGGFSFSAGHLWPYKLVAGLIRIAVSRGLQLHTKTMVTGIGQTPSLEGFWPVTTSRGVIHARKIIFATNAYTSALAPEYSRAIVPCKGLCTQIQAAPGAPYEAIPETYVIRHGPGCFIYQISRKDGSIIVGGAEYTYRDSPAQWYSNSEDGSVIPNVETYFDGYMQRTFHGWEDSQATVKQKWTGVMGYSADSLPHIGAIPNKPGQFIAAGFNGHGMPVVFLGGKAVAEMAQKSISFSQTGLPRLFETTAERLTPIYDDTMGYP